MWSYQGIASCSLLPPRCFRSEPLASSVCARPLSSILLYYGNGLVWSLFKAVWHSNLRPAMSFCITSNNHWIIVLLGPGPFGHGIYFGPRTMRKLIGQNYPILVGFLIQVLSLSRSGWGFLHKSKQRWGPKHPFFGHWPEWRIIFLLLSARHDSTSWAAWDTHYFSCSPHVNAYIFPDVRRASCRMFSIDGRQMLPGSTGSMHTKKILAAIRFALTYTTNILWNVSNFVSTSWIDYATIAVGVRSL